jgi:hypothetical protein
MKLRDYSMQIRQPIVIERQNQSKEKASVINVSAPTLCRFLANINSIKYVYPAEH